MGVASHVVHALGLCILDLPGDALAAPASASCGWKGVILSLSLSLPLTAALLGYARGCPGSTCISLVWLGRCHTSLSLSLSPGVHPSRDGTASITGGTPEPGRYREHHRGYTRAGMVPLSVRGQREPSRLGMEGGGEGGA